MGNNILQIIKAMMGHATPKDIVMNMLKTNSNPIFVGLVKDLENGNEQKVQQFAENVLKERGLDPEKEFTNFRNTLNK